MTCLELLLLRVREWGRGCPLFGSRMVEVSLTARLWIIYRLFSSQDNR